MTNDELLTGKKPKIRPTKSISHIKHSYKANIANDARNLEFDLLVHRLQNYKLIYGNYEVAPDFVIPVGDELWDQSSWGHRLGEQVVKISQSFSIVTALLQQGIIIKPSDKINSEDEEDKQSYYENYNSVHNFGGVSHTEDVGMNMPKDSQAVAIATAMETYNSIFPDRNDFFGIFLYSIVHAISFTDKFIQFLLRSNKAYLFWI